MRRGRNGLRLADRLPASLKEESFASGHLKRRAYCTLMVDGTPRSACGESLVAKARVCPRDDDEPLWPRDDLVRARILISSSLPGVKWK